MAYFVLVKPRRLVNTPEMVCLALRAADDGWFPLTGAGDYVEKRYEALRDAIRRHGDAKGAALPLVLAENASRAPTDADGEKLLGNDKPWRPQAFRQARPLGPYPTCGLAVRGWLSRIAMPWVVVDDASRVPTSASIEKQLGNDNPWRSQDFHLPGAAPAFLSVNAESLTRVTGLK